jgi:hypothetical protein
MTITEFLEARIAEDEKVVAHPEPHERGGGYTYADVGGLSEVLTVGTDRVLAECAAKRAIIALYMDGALGEISNGERWTNPLAVFAAVYADHPDYNPEWTA